MEHVRADNILQATVECAANGDGNLKVVCLQHHHHYSYGIEINARTDRKVTDFINNVWECGA